MIECITAENALRHAEALDEMFRRRHEIFVEARGWALPAQNGIERDQFDTEDATYLLSLGPDAQVLGGMRLLPTTKPHLLSEVFPQLASGGVPIGPHILEMTRYFTIRDRTQPELMRQATGELLCAMFEFSMERGMAWITTLFDTFYLRRMRQNRWGETILGPSRPYDEGIAVAIKIPVSLTNLESTRRVHGIQGPVLRSFPHSGTSQLALGQRNSVGVAA